MKRLLTAAAAAVLVTSGLGAATINGKVSFLTKRGQRPVVTETMIWLEPQGKAPKKAASTFAMTTRSKEFLPHVLAVPAGSTVTFPNEDPIAHNLFSLTPGNTFDLGLYRRGAGKTHKFDTPGVVNVYCNVHPNMSAVVHVMSTPYYGFANEQGNFSFNVPAGKYRLVAWNEQGGSTFSDIDVSANGTVTGPTALTIDGRNARLTQHTNKYGQPYRAAREY